MKSLFKFSLPVFMVLIFSGCGSMKNSEAELVSDSRDARATITQEYPEVGALFNSSVAYAIFPNVGKGAYIIGGSSGNGTVYQGGKLVGYADLKEIDVGIQAGGKAFIEVLFFEDEDSFEDFKEGGYELAANASAVILEEGASKDVEFRDGVAIVTMPKAGAMAGISVGGQRFEFDPVQ